MESNNNEAKSFIFSALPDVGSELIIAAWGRIVNDMDGSYKQEIILKKYSSKIDLENLWDLEGGDYYISKIDIGKVRVLSPGTIVQNQKIKRSIEEYLQPRQIQLDDPQSLEDTTTSKVLRGHGIFKEYVAPGLQERVGKASMKVLKTDGERIIFPCCVIADYYYFGRAELTKAVLDGTIHLKLRNRNTAFNPRRVLKGKTDEGLKTAFVELGAKMWMDDRVKIARMAHDEDFNWKCMGLSASLISKPRNGVYYHTDFPIIKPTTLTVYGTPIKRKNSSISYFLVHSIAKCTSQLPFDILIVGKPFRGKTELELGSGGGDSNGDDQDKDGTKLGPKPKKKTRTIFKKKKDKKVVGEKKGQFDAATESVSFTRDQETNFSDDNVMNELDLLDPDKQKEAIEWLKKFKVPLEYSSNPDKSGKGNIIPLSFFSKGPLKPKPYVPTTAFEVIEKMTALIETTLKFKNYNVSTEIRVPCKEGDDSPDGKKSYSTFPIDDMDDDPKYLRKHYNYCFLNVQKQGHEIFRRVYIKELVIDEKYFYVMDIEAKYKKNGKLPKSSAGVIFYTKDQIPDKLLKKILLKLVDDHKERGSRWGFLTSKYKYPQAMIKHQEGNQKYQSVEQFIRSRVSKPTA